MRNVLILSLMAASLPLVAQAAKKAPAAAPVAASKTAPARPAARSANGLPANAVQVDDFTWHAKDEKGVNWVYRKNPFGFSKVKEEDANKPVAPLTTPMDVRVRDTGDGKLQFERTGPWGTQKWSKSRAELTEEEKAWAAKGQEAAKK